MFGLPFQPPSLSIAAAQARALPFVETAIAAAASGNFEEAEKALLSGKACYIQSDLSNYCNVEAEFTAMFAGWRSQVEKARAKWEEGAPARAAEWEKGAPARKAAEEVARLKAEIARVEQEEVDRQAALAKEALEKLRIQREEEEEKQRKAEVTSLERDAAALREKLAAMKELMAMKAADPLAYAAACSAPSPAPASAPPPSPEVANWLKRAAGTWGANRKWCILKAKEAQDAEKSPPTPAVHDHSLSQADKQAWEGLRAPVQGVSISYAVTHFAGKAGISLEEAEAVLAHLKPADGHRANALLAQQVFARFAKSKGIPVKGAMVAMREWAEGRD
jgi:hypothetical protein